MERDIPIYKKKKTCVKMVIVLEKIELTWMWQLNAFLFEQVN